jgi:excisionase family DNA binding protein
VSDPVTPALLTVSEATQRLGVSRTTLYNMMRRGDLAWVQVGAHRRVEETAVQAYIAQQRQGGA